MAPRRSSNASKREWKNAAVCASNLSELELTLGEVAGAVKDAEQSVSYADRSGDAFVRMAFRTTHAEALHQAGRRAEAEARFREAEQMQAERKPAYPLLDSMGGFRYCDLLLTEAEREAGKTEGEMNKEGLLAVCRAVSERAASALRIVLKRLSQSLRHWPESPHPGPCRALRRDSRISQRPR